MSDALIGLSIGKFILFSAVFAFFALLTGWRHGANWASGWLVVIYGALLGTFHRFLIYALAGGELLNGIGWVAAMAASIALGLAAFALARARRMARQYPWMRHKETRDAGPTNNR